MFSQPVATGNWRIGSSDHLESLPILLYIIINLKSEGGGAHITEAGHAPGAPMHRAIIYSLCLRIMKLRTVVT